MTVARLFFCGLLTCAVAVAACAPKAPALPTGPGVPLPDAAALYDQATAACRGIQTYSAVLALSGRAGDTRLRGRIEAGFAKPAKAVLIGVAPFGRPLFVLTADGARGTLVLPRDERVLSDAPAEQIIDALAGVPLGADALRTAISGCGLATGRASGDGRAYGDTQASLSVSGNTVYLRRSGTQWVLMAETNGPLTVLYSDYANGRPTTIRLRSVVDGRVASDLTLRASQVEINSPIDSTAFNPQIPEHAVPLTLEELRRAGPLGIS